ncbi:MAG: hypothetical protein ACLURV_04815 [Gallintestinimicrobium sp.]
MLTNMLEQGYITQAQYDEAESDTDSLYAESRPPTSKSAEILP